MKIAVDKNSISAVKNNNNEYVYLYDNENYKDLIALNMHCLKYNYCNYVDINLTNYNVNCIKKARITDRDYDILPKRKDYKFAVIVPNFNNDHGNYNDKTYLKNCIESILNQSYGNLDLVVIDDCSIDSSVDTIKSYMNDKRVHLIVNRRKRYNGGSRNVGIDYALDNLDFDYFCFLDSDDWWKDNEVLKTINERLYNHEMATLSCEMVGTNGIIYTSKNKPTCYEDLYSINNNLWCTAWARVIRKDKIVYFCEDTLMEDRVWTYRLADNLDFNNILSIEKVCYCWNRMNTTTSVSIVRNDFWNASAYCHIGHQLQLLSQLKHKEMIPILKQRIEQCKIKVNSNIFQQY
jgi:glycosyltransferase involved in cell wall biosynthesis